MSYRREFTIEKSPAETRTFTLPFETEDPTLLDPVLSEVVVTAQDDFTGNDVTSVILDDSVTSFAGKEATFRVRNGVSGRNYKISVAVRLADGDIWIADGTLKVSDS